MKNIDFGTPRPRFRGTCVRETRLSTYINYERNYGIFRQIGPDGTSTTSVVGGRPRVYFFLQRSPPTRFEPEQYVQRTQSTTAVALVTSLSPNGKPTWSRLSINKLETLCGRGRKQKLINIDNISIVAYPEGRRV